MDLFCLSSCIISSWLSYFWQVLDAISPFLVLIASVAAATTAIWAFKLSRRILYYQLLSRYSSPEMGKALEIMWELSRLRSQNKDAFDKVVEMYRDEKLKLEVPWTEKVEGGTPRERLFLHWHEDINQARRQVSHFFITAFQMFSETKALDKVCFKEICELNSFKLLYHVVEWLELAHATSWDFDPVGRFTKLLEQSGQETKLLEQFKQEGIKDLKGLRPPGRT